MQVFNDEGASELWDDLHLALGTCWIRPGAPPRTARIPWWLRELWKLGFSHPVLGAGPIRVALCVGS